MCAKECICTECMKNDNCDPITDIFFGTEQDEGARFIQLPDCKHIFETKGLDRYEQLQSKKRKKRENISEDNRYFSFQFS